MRAQNPLSSFDLLLQKKNQFSTEYLVVLFARNFFHQMLSTFSTTGCPKILVRSNGTILFPKLTSIHILIFENPVDELDGAALDDKDSFDDKAVLDDKDALGDV